MASRLATTIFYIEDPDSLRFALSVAEGFDVAALRPHFPGYPVFWAAARPLYAITGRFAVSFALIGGVATFALCHYAQRIMGAPLRSPEGVALVGLIFFSPLVWLMGNRYMPDLSGLALAVAAFYYLARAENDCAAVIGMALAGVLAGWRLSYAPFVLPAAAWALWRARPAGWMLVAGTGGVLVWLVPMIVDMGWQPLLAAAQGQTAGHFTEFGGTVQTNPDLGRRLMGLTRGLWADGLGAWWPGRHPLTLIVGAGSLAFLVWGGRRGLPLPQRTKRLLVAGGIAYAIWIFLFQNVIYKSRHVLPLLSLLWLPMAYGGAALWRSRRLAARGGVAVTLAALIAVTGVLTWQHRKPTAIAQMRQLAERYNARSDSLRIVSIPLVNFYLSAQQVKARYVPVTDTAAVRQSSSVPTLVVGEYPRLLKRTPDREHTFYHNPYVNRMWPEVKVQVYE